MSVMNQRRITSIIAAGESNGWDSPLVWRSIEIMSNWTQSRPPLSVDPFDCGVIGYERKVVLLGVKPRASGLCRQHSATELWHPSITTFYSYPFVADLLWVIRRWTRSLLVFGPVKESHPSDSPAVWFSSDLTTHSKHATSVRCLQRAKWMQSSICPGDTKAFLGMAVIKHCVDRW